MRKVETMLVCDVCETDEAQARVKVQRLKVNGREVEGEACERCFESEPIPVLLRAFRRPGTSPRKITEKIGAVRQMV